MPAMAGRCGKIQVRRIQDRHQNKGTNGDRNNRCGKLIEVVSSLYPAASLLCHLAAFAAHPLAAILLGTSRSRRRSAGKHGQHHDEHDQHRREAREAPHDTTIFLILLAIPLTKRDAGIRYDGPEVVRGEENSHSSAERCECWRHIAGEPLGESALLLSEGDVCCASEHDSGKSCACSVERTTLFVIALPKETKAR